MGTITTYGHCLVKEGKAYEGTKEEIVHQICKFDFNEYRELSLKVKGFKERTYHSYSEEYTKEEMYKDAVQFIFNKLYTSYGFRYYRDLRF